jgi:putative ABC transport system substrate-binding protein
MVATLFAISFLGSACFAQAQQVKVYRVGVILPGGPYETVIDGLKDGLRELGFEVARHYALETRDLQGDSSAAVEAARTLERNKVDLIYTVANSLTILAKRATTKVPIVFAVGSDPVIDGLVESFAKPGGRLTGVHYVVGDLTEKRLEILKAIVPELRRVVTFYNPSNASAVAGAKSARAAGRQLHIEVIERHVASVEELQRSLLALKAQDADAYFHSNDGMVTSQAQFIIDTARSKKLPTIFAEQGLVTRGALAGYGVNYREAGRLSARYVHQILTGTSSPGNLPVESLNKVGLAVNLKTARALGLTVSQAVLLRADAVIQ